MKHEQLKSNTTQQVQYMINYKLVPHLMVKAEVHFELLEQRIKMNFPHAKVPCYQIIRLVYLTCQKARKSFLAG